MKNLAVALSFLALFCHAPSSGASVLIHDYQFQNNLNDSVGNVALIGDGGNVGSGNYAFNANQGLTLSDALPNGDSYSIALNFNFSTLNGWQKIVDFSDRGPDTGFYSYYTPIWSLFDNSNIRSGADALQTNTDAEVVVTRDASSNLFSAYLNGVLQYEYLDSAKTAAFNPANHNIMHFFEDDSATGFSEAGAGTVNSIRIWDSALTANEVANINAVPIPSTFILLASGLSSLGWLAGRRKIKAAGI